MAADNTPPTAAIDAGPTFTNAVNLTVFVRFSKNCSTGGAFECSSTSSCDVSYPCPLLYLHCVKLADLIWLLIIMDTLYWNGGHLEDVDLRKNTKRGHHVFKRYSIDCELKTCQLFQLQYSPTIIGTDQPLWSFQEKILILSEYSFWKWIRYLIKAPENYNEINWIKPRFWIC